MSNLLDRLDAVQVSWQSLVPEDCVAHILRIESNFQRVTKQLNAWKQLLSETDLEVSEFHSLRKEKRSRAEKPADRYYFMVDKDFDHYQGSGYILRNMFSPAYGLKYIEETLLGLFVERNRLIIDYLNSKYSLKLSPDEHDTALSLEDIMRAIIGELDGESLQQAEITRVVGWFKDQYHDDLKVAGKDITFHPWFLARYSECFDQDTDSDFSKLLRVLSWFEYGYTDRAKDLVTILGRSPDYGRRVDINWPKLKAWKYYQNRKLVLTFSSPEVAQLFSETFSK